VILAVVLSGFLQSVTGISNHADSVVVTIGIAADFASVQLIDGVINQPVVLPQSAVLKACTSASGRFQRWPGVGQFRTNAWQAMVAQLNA